MVAEVVVTPRTYIPSEGMVIDPLVVRVIDDPAGVVNPTVLPETTVPSDQIESPAAPAPLVTG